MSHLRKIAVAEIPNNLDEDGPEGDRSREEFGKLAYALNVQQFAAEGLNFGYSYADSPIIVADDGVAPSYTMGSHIPSTVPGCRTPHVWLDEGVSLYDALGLWYTLIVVGPTTDLDSADLWATELNEAGLPIDVVSLQHLQAPECYETRYVIVREDQHVAWRGNTLPENATEFAHSLGAIAVTEAVA